MSAKPFDLRSERGRRFLGVCATAAVATVAVLSLLPQILAGLVRWPSFEWISSPLYYQRLPAFLWPAAFVALLLIAVLPLMLPARLRASTFVGTVSRATVMAATLLFLALLLAALLTPVT